MKNLLLAITIMMTINVSADSFNDDVQVEQCLTSVGSEYNSACFEYCEAVTDWYLSVEIAAVCEEILD